MDEQDIINRLIEHINKAIEVGSVTNVQVAEVLRYFFTQLQGLNGKYIRKDMEDATDWRVTFNDGIVVSSLENINLKRQISKALVGEGYLLESDESPSKVSLAIQELISSVVETLGGLSNVVDQADTASEGSILIMRNGIWSPEQALSLSTVFLDFDLTADELWAKLYGNKEGRFLGFYGSKQFELNVSWSFIGTNVEISYENGLHTEIIILEKGPSGTVTRSEEYIEYITI